MGLPRPEPGTVAAGHPEDTANSIGQRVQPTHEGFGTEVLTRMPPYELRPFARSVSSTMACVAGSRFRSRADRPTRGKPIPTVARRFRVAARPQPRQMEPERLRPVTRWSRPPQQKPRHPLAAECGPCGSSAPVANATDWPAAPALGQTARSRSPRRTSWPNPNTSGKVR